MRTHRQVIHRHTLDTHAHGYIINYDMTIKLSYAKRDLAKDIKIMENCGDC